MAAHRYWRLRVTEGTAAAYVYIAEVQFATSPGGSNVATGGVASASSESSATFDAPKAFDGNSSTYWSSSNPSFVLNNGTYTGGEYIQYVFATAQDIVEMKVTAMTQYFPLSMSLFWSDDGVKWTFQKTFTGLAWSNGETKTFDLTYVPVGAGRLATAILRRIGSVLSQPLKPIGNLFRTTTWLRYFNWSRPLKTSWLTGKKRIAGSTTVLGNPKARTVHLLEQRTHQILDTRHTDASGVFEFANIADMQYTLVGEDRTKEQNSVIAANVTPVD